MKIYDPCTESTFDPFAPVPAAGEPRREALGRLRCWLLRAAGCEWGLEKLLELADERTSYEELASAIGTNKGSLWRLVRKAHDQIRLAALAEVAAAALHASTGFTLDPRSARLVGPTAEDRFAVGLHGHGRTLAAPTVEGIHDFVRVKARRLLRQSGRPVYLGGWRPGAASAPIRLDLSVLIGDEAEARAFGLRQRQRCVYNLRTGEEVWLRGTDARAAA